MLNTRFPAPSRPLEDGRVECGLCPHRCKLAEGARGICFARRARAGQVELAAYGRISGVAVDPIEKKPLYHFLPGSRSLSFGTIGCNLLCRFCQNWHISKPSDESALDPEPVAPEQIAQTARRAGCASVSYTYNEPIVSYEFTLDCAAAVREAGARNVAVTAGYIEPEPRATFFRWMDAANIDLKSFRESFYRRLCGVHLAPVLETIEYVGRLGSCWLELTTLIIPGENDSPGEIRELAEWIVERLGPDVPLHFSAFHPNYRMQDRPATPLATLREARRIAKAVGVRHVYTGNVWDEEGATTWCARCGAALIRRRGFAVVEMRLAQGACPDCGERCPGVWA
ncbi:MAG: AmmeMemoRadiSam system radical SAM enzyme [Kiritimatiellae bacterium]|nr:AmmeMemoRadiSam system radical SAM enzyme [Kiritimatiellia bacterium]